jgi:hypothetical protein
MKDATLFAEMESKMERQSNFLFDFYAQECFCLEQKRRLFDKF